MNHRKSTARKSVLALSGGVGGAKLVCGLARVLVPGALTIVANTGDDFEHLGLCISLDIDTFTYYLCPRRITERASRLGSVGRDLVVHGGARRSGGQNVVQAGGQGSRHPSGAHPAPQHGGHLSDVTSDFARSLGISSHIIPMTDARVRAPVVTEDGVLEFQRYFVEARCLPKVTGFICDGANQARPHPDIVPR